MSNAERVDFPLPSQCPRLIEARLYSTDKLIHVWGFAASVSEARRLREAGAVAFGDVVYRAPKIVLFFHEDTYLGYYANYPS